MSTTGNTESTKQICFKRNNRNQNDLVIIIDNQFLKKYKDHYSPERAELVEAILDSLDALLVR